MANVFCIVEGQTEEQFYKNVLGEYYLHDPVFEVVVMPHKRNAYARKNKGGRISYQACMDQVKRFLRQTTHCERVFLIYDYYGLDSSFLSHLPAGTRKMPEWVQSIRERLEQDIDDPRFRFVLQVHEFEAYLFSAPETIARHHGKPTLISSLNAILENYQNHPEWINNSPKTAPSKRLQILIPEHGKIVDGIPIVKEIGIEKIRAMCEYFDEFCSMIDELKTE